MITIEVLLFAAAREAAGAGSIRVELPDDATVGDAFAHLRVAHPALGPVLGASRAAVDEEFAPPSRSLSNGDTMAVLPPVSGG